MDGRSEGATVNPANKPAPLNPKNLPKVDLHRHLEGSLRLETVQELAEAGSIPLPANRRELRRLLTVGPSDPRTRSHFLGRFAHIREVFQSEEIIRRISREAVQDAAMDGIRYLELHLTPAALAEASRASYSEVIGWVWEGVEAAEADGTRVRLVVSVNRHEPVVMARQVAEAALAGRAQAVVGLDLAGDEGGYQAEPFRELFAEAKGAGLFLSVHAGEWAGAASVREAMELLGADRIAHGVRIMEDKDCVLAARDRRVPFAVCLTSNVQTGVVGELGEHPLAAMIQAGLQVSLNTDDPGISGITLTDEYQRAVTHLGLSHETLKGLILSGAQSAFLPDREKRDFLRDLQSELGLAPQVVDWE